MPLKKDTLSAGEFKTAGVAKILLARATDVVQRKGMSNQLRDVFPNMRVDPTDEEVLFAVWNYLNTAPGNSVDSKKRTFSCDELMAQVLCLNAEPGVNTGNTSSIRNKVLGHLQAPSRSIAVQYSLEGPGQP